jgi:hypothetical protein
MLYYVSHGREPVLKFVCHDETGKTSANGEDPYFPWSVGILWAQLEWIDTIIGGISGRETIVYRGLLRSWLGGVDTGLM